MQRTYTRVCCPPLCDKTCTKGWYTCLTHLRTIFCPFGVSIPFWHTKWLTADACVRALCVINRVCITCLIGIDHDLLTGWAPCCQSARLEPGLLDSQTDTSPQAARILTDSPLNIHVRFLSMPMLLGSGKGKEWFMKTNRR